MTPLDHLTAGRVPAALQWAVRIAICQHVRGAGEIGPCWRKGSNTYRSDRWEYLWSGQATPCPDCGCTEGMTSWQHYLACPSCGWSEPAGDYDWWSLADVLRFKADELAGLIEEEPASLIVHGFDVMTRQGDHDFREACRQRRIEREQGAPQSSMTPPEERLAQLRSERAGYVEGRAGRPLPDDADDHFRTGYESGSRLFHRVGAAGMGVLHHG